MKLSLLFIFSFFSLSQFSQSFPEFSCFQSTLAVTVTYYPNSISSFSSNGASGEECLYLCGPNTIVYDTVQNSFCRTTLLNAGCHFITSSPTCLAADFVFAKNNSTLTINANANGNSFRVYYEPLATIIDLTGAAQTYSCSLITFPAINCSIGVFETDKKESNLLFHPNPVSDMLHIVSNKNFEKEIEIINYLGQTVLKTEFKKEIDVSAFPNGIYFLQLKNNSGNSVTKKLVVSK